MGNEDVYAALACLRAEVEGRNTEKVGRGLVTLEGRDFERHPSQLPPCFFLRKPPMFWRKPSKFWRKPPLWQGYWEQKDCSFAIRSEGPSLMPYYIGMKTFLVFRLPDDTKTDWLMVEYRLINLNDCAVDDLVLCEVFQLKRKGPAPSGDARAPLPNQVPLHPTRSSSSPTNPETPFDVNMLFSDFDVNDHNIGGPFPEYTDLSIEDYAPQGFNVDASWGGFNVDAPWGPPSSGREGQHWENKEPGVPNEVQVMRKRSRSSENDESVWNDFTKIRTKDPKVVYAACHYCDKMLKAPSRNGTSHLWRHTEITCKMRLHQPSQVLCHSVDRGEGDTAALAPMLVGNQQGDGTCI